MSFSSQHHSFDIKLAAKYGIQKAILIHHFQHWIRVNRKRKKNIRNDKCWSYQSRADIAAHFPYLTEDSVIHHIEGLLKDGILISDNFNRAKFDKTLWYAFADEKLFGVDQESIDQMEGYSNNSYERGKPLSKGENPSREGENPGPIPDTKKEDTKETLSKERESGKQRHIDHVFLTKAEYQKLQTEYGEAKTELYIKKLDAWLGSTGKIRKSHYKTIISWNLKDEKTEEGPEQNKKKGKGMR